MSLVNECHVSEGYHLFFDNWFTSFELLDMLKEHKIGATGTIRADRCKNAPLPSKKTWRNLVVEPILKCLMETMSLPNGMTIQ